MRESLCDPGGRAGSRARADALSVVQRPRIVNVEDVEHELQDVLPGIQAVRDETNDKLIEGDAAVAVLCGARIANEPAGHTRISYWRGTHQVDELEDCIRERRRPLLERLEQLFSVDIAVS